jgi:hypothetical protein
VQQIEDGLPLRLAQRPSRRRPRRTGRRRSSTTVDRRRRGVQRPAGCRERALARIAEELATLERKKTADDRRDAEALLQGHPSMSRYLAGRRGRLLIDQQKVRAEERVDGKFLLSSSDDSLAAEEIALGYKLHARGLRRTSDSSSGRRRRPRSARRSWAGRHFRGEWRCTRS